MSTLDEIRETLTTFPPAWNDHGFVRGLDVDLPWITEPTEWSNAVALPDLMFARWQGAYNLTLPMSKAGRSLGKTLNTLTVAELRSNLSPKFKVAGVGLVPILLLGVGYWYAKKRKWV